MNEFLYSTPVEVVVYVMIIASVGAMVTEVASPSLAEDYRELFDRAEVGFTGFFIVEYVTKLSVAPNRWSFFRRSFIDLLALLPFLRFFRLLRGVRILRLLRLVRLLRLGNLVSRRLSLLEGVGGNLREVLIVVVVFVATLIAGSIGIVIFERFENPDINNVGDGLWWSVVTLTTVGYGDKYPVTAEGKVLGAAIMLVGLSFYGLVAGLGSNFIINRLKKGGEWMVSTFVNHVVILGVNDKLDGIVQELLRQGKRVVIITDDIDRVPQYPENLVAIIEGDFIEPKVLRKARLEEAATAIIVADTRDRSTHDADARSVLATLAVEQIKPEIKTVVEALHTSTGYHLRNAGVDEIVVSGELGAEMMAFSSDHAGYSKNLRTLMRFVHQNRVTTHPVSERHAGKTLTEVQTTLAMERKVLIGVYRGGKENEQTLDPDYKLRMADDLVYIEIV